MKTLQDCKDEVARKYGLGKTLVTGHRVSYFDEAAELYAQAYHEEKTRNTTCDHRYHNQNGRYMLYERYCEKCGKYLESNPTE